MISRTIVLALGALSLAVAAGCASSSPPQDDAAAVKDALCSGGGSSGGSCVSQDGYCPPECSICTRSAETLIALRNLSPCDEPGTGGGGAGGSCSNHYLSVQESSRTSMEDAVARLQPTADRSCGVGIGGGTRPRCTPYSATVGSPNCWEVGGGSTTTHSYNCWAEVTCHRRWQ